MRCAYCDFRDRDQTALRRQLLNLRRRIRLARKALRELGAHTHRSVDTARRVLDLRRPLRGKR